MNNIPNDMDQSTLDNIATVLKMYHAQPATTARYFAPLLPWQHDPWQKITHNITRLAHGLLFAGMQGIGKHVFVWHLTAWLLCNNKQTAGACGKCQSCLWLKAGTHPNLIVLPSSSILLVDDNDSSIDSEDNEKPSKSNRKPKPKNKAKSSGNADKEVKLETIKIDDIRALTPFLNQSSQGVRICVIDYADTMTVAAANALLKTLEEPNDGVYLFLISDAPAKLLPTIKSRVQKAPIDAINPVQAQTYLQQLIHGHATDYNEQKNKGYDASQLLSLSSGAPLAALSLMSALWYSKRQLWLTTWLALRDGRRSSTAASDYWQQQLSLKEFIQLSELMVMDIKRIQLGLPAKQQDLDLGKLDFIADLSFAHVQSMTDTITDINLAVRQNVQPKLGYDKLMEQLVHL